MHCIEVPIFYFFLFRPDIHFKTWRLHRLDFSSGILEPGFCSWSLTGHAHIILALQSVSVNFTIFGLLGQPKSPNRPIGDQITHWRKSQEAARQKKNKKATVAKVHFSGGNCLSVTAWSIRWAAESPAR